MNRTWWVLGAVALAAPAVGQAGWAQELLTKEPSLATPLALVERFSRLLTFLGLFLFIGLVFTPLARRIVSPRSSGGLGEATQDEQTARRVAIARAVVWSVALVAACEVIGLHWFLKMLEVVFGLVGTVVVAAIIGAAALAVGLAIGSRSRDLALSLLGWYYIKHHESKPGADRELDLGEGVTGKVVGVDALHTAFDIGDGKREVRPNSWLMRTYFHWGEEPLPEEPAEPAAGPVAATGAVSVGPSHVVPPPAPPDLPPVSGETPAPPR